MKVLVTGGCGFIGSNFVKYVLENFKNDKIVNVDKKTYAGGGNNVEHMGLDAHPNYIFYNADICDRKKMEEIFEKERPEIVVNFAAESHVDRSITHPEQFVMSNVFGVFNLLEAARKTGIKLFVQISTDEVYGSLSNNSPSSKESDLLKPRSPYSASKAAAEHLAMSYFHTYNLPVIVTRSSNNYGPYQFPEKLIPLFATNLIDGKKVPLMYSKENPGLNVRDWLHVEDNCAAIWHIIQKGKYGETYNIAGNHEKTNIEITKSILSSMGLGEEMIEFVPHRLGHDFRYSISDEKLRGLGFEKKHGDFEKALKDTIIWYKKNENWWRPLKK
ncbi:MAG: dTDP-glucose 4,6-dehydratase [archaeon]|jgi:dTDP-glucose 4,6-dehydratase|nr:dTDP-glucose 4,6-dehydratase [archaeon]